MAATDILADKTVRAALNAAVQAGKPRKISDGAGLVLEVRPKGAGWWRLRYWRDGKEGMLSLGTYPEVSLKDARQRRDEARKLVAAGIDPSEHRTADKVQRELVREAQALADDAYASKAQLRTLQRRIKTWRAEKAKDLILGQLRNTRSLSGRILETRRVQKSSEPRGAGRSRPAGYGHVDDAPAAHRLRPWTTRALRALRCPPPPPSTTCPQPSMMKNKKAKPVTTIPG